MPDGDEVLPGPFDSEPLALGRLLSEGFSPAVPGEEVVRRCERWLVDVLDEADVARPEGWSVAQVVGGWVRRAARPVARELVAPGVTRVG